MTFSIARAGLRKLISTPAALLLGSVTVAQGQTDRVPLYDDLGNHHYAVNTGNPAAQRYFDQGL